MAIHPLRLRNLEGLPECEPIAPRSETPADSAPEVAHEVEIEELRRQLATLEARHQMTTEQMRVAYHRNELSDSTEFGRWLILDGILCDLLSDGETEAANKLNGKAK